MEMGRDLLLSAEISGIRQVTFLPLGMGFLFLHSADQAVAGDSMAVALCLFQRAHQLGHQTGIVVTMILRFLQSAGQDIREAILCMEMGSLLSRRADQGIRYAAFRMGMPRCLFPVTDQTSGNTGLPMGMALLFREGALQHLIPAFLRMGVAGDFLQRTDQLPLHTRIAVNVLLHAAEGFACHGDARQLQSPEYAEYHQ